MAFKGYLRQSTGVTLMVGPFIDDTDGKTAETGLTLGSATVRLSKIGGNMAPKNYGSACVHDELGKYTCYLDGTDTNTLGLLDLNIHQSGSLPVDQQYLVIGSNWHDSMCSSDKLQIDARQWNGTSVATPVTAGIPTVAVSDKTGFSLSAAQTFDITGSLSGSVGSVTGNVGGSLTGNIGGKVIGSIGSIRAAGINNASFNTDIGSTAFATNRIARAVWQRLTAALTTAGSVGKAVADNINAPIATVDTVADNVYSVLTSATNGNPALRVLLDSIVTAVITNAQGTDIAADIVAVSSTVGAHGVNLTNITLPNQTMDITGNLSGSVGSLTGHTPQTGDSYLIVSSATSGNSAIRVMVSNMKTVTDVLGRPQGEPPQGAPSVSASPIAKLAYLYKSWRNQKDSDGTTRQFYNDAGAVVDHKSTLVATTTTVTIGKIGSGP